jgi:uncharacterized protein (DUF1810 family)
MMIVIFRLQRRAMACPSALQGLGPAGHHRSAGRRDHRRMPDPYNLDRFVVAQAPLFDTVLGELAAGAKRSHWMWFVFPQLAGLGRSSTARFYGIGSRDEALAYWRHPLLGPRLLQCCSVLLPHAARGAERVLGAVDALKLRSSLTLFERVAPQQAIFDRLLADFYAGERDPATLALLDR